MNTWVPLFQYAGVAAVLSAVTALAVTDTANLGMSAEMGFNTDPAFVDRSIRELRALGLGSTRMGMDNVGGSSVGGAFDFAARDVVVAKLRAAGIGIHAVISPRSMVSHGASFTEWTNNWNYFVRGVMARYKDHVRYYTIGNEPDLESTTPQQSVDFTRIAFLAARSIDPTIKIESPPVSAPDVSYLQQMLQLGVGDYADYIGVHVYGSQINDSRLSRPWQWMEALGVRRPIHVSESGVSPAWAPAGLDGQVWRKRWLAQFHVARKRMGIGHTLLFSLTFDDLNWAYVDQKNGWSPIEPGYSEIRDWFRDEPFANGGFELPNDSDHEWHVYFNPDSVTPPSTITFASNDAAGAHSGSGYARAMTGSASSSTSIILRRVAGQLTRGSAVRLGAWVYVAGSGSTRLKAQGFDSLDGDREVVATSTKTRAWEYLTLEVPEISNPWVVVELSANGTGVAGDHVKWDDVELVVTRLAPPAPPQLFVAAGRDARVDLTWQPAPGATHYVLSRAAGSVAGSFTLLATVTNTSFSDGAVTNGGFYHYVVAAMNAAGASTNSELATASPVPALTPVPFVARGTQWKYLDDGSNQGIAWRNVGFNDGAWLGGIAQFGYGDGDETTLVRSNRTDGTRIITTYYRRAFYVPEPSVMTNLVLSMMRDDGGVVFLNGSEVFRSNMPGDRPITYTTGASSSVGSPNESAFYTTNLPPAVLRSGTNILAVEIHQVNNTSSDTSFDLSLTGETMVRPRLVIARDKDRVVLQWPWFAGAYRVFAADALQGGVWQPVTNGIIATNTGSFSLTVPQETTQRFYRLETAVE